MQMSSLNNHNTFFIQKIWYTPEYMYICYTLISIDMESEDVAKLVEDCKTSNRIFLRCMTEKEQEREDD